MGRVRGFTTAVPNCTQGDEFLTSDGWLFRIVGMAEFDHIVAATEAPWLAELCVVNRLAVGSL